MRRHGIQVLGEGGQTRTLQGRPGAVVAGRRRAGDFVFAADADQVVDAVELPAPPATIVDARGGALPGFQCRSGEPVRQGIQLCQQGLCARTLDGLDAPNLLKNGWKRSL